MNTEKELETLRELKRLCELGIDLIESGALVRDPNSSAAPYDFRIGNFGVVDLLRVRFETKVYAMDDARSESSEELRK